MWSPPPLPPFSSSSYDFRQGKQGWRRSASCGALWGGGGRESQLQRAEGMQGALLTAQDCSSIVGGTLRKLLTPLSNSLGAEKMGQLLLHRGVSCHAGLLGDGPGKVLAHEVRPGTRVNDDYQGHATSGMALDHWV